MTDIHADIQARHAPAVRAGQLQITSEWGQPTLGYILMFRPDPAAVAGLAAVQDLVLAAEPSLLRQPESQLHNSVAWLLATREDFGRPKDEIWQEQGEDWLKIITSVTDETGPMRLRFHKIVMTNAAVIAIAEEPNPVAPLRRELTAALGLDWPITYDSLGTVHVTLLRYRQPLADPAGLLRRISAASISVETDVSELILVRETVYPTLDYDILRHLPLRGGSAEVSDTA
jgi:hypothetical protein